MFEREYDVKIVVFYKDEKYTLLKYQSKLAPHDKTVYMYLHNGHYHRVIKPLMFVSEAYFCQFCPCGCSNKRDHQCDHVCDVCNDSDCYKHKSKTVWCADFIGI